jgi:hypothetical protein
MRSAISASSSLLMALLLVVSPVEAAAGSSSTGTPGWRRAAARALGDRLKGGPLTGSMGRRGGTFEVRPSDDLVVLRVPRRRGGTSHHFVTLKHVGLERSVVVVDRGDGTLRFDAKPDTGTERYRVSTRDLGDQVLELTCSRVGVDAPPTTYRYEASTGLFMFKVEGEDRYMVARLGAHLSAPDLLWKQSELVGLDWRSHQASISEEVRRVFRLPQ